MSLVYGPLCTSLELRGSFSGSGDVNSDSEINLSQALSIVWGSTKLQTLELAVWSGLTDAGWSDLATGFNSTRSLTDLKLDICMLENDSFAAVGRLPHLRHLTLLTRPVSTAFDADLCQVLHVSRGSFGALEQLNITGNWANRSIISLSCLAALFAQVHSITINLFRNSNYIDIEALSNNLRDNAPSLTCIEYRFSAQNTIKYQYLEPLMDKPLTSVTLDKICLDEEEEEFSRLLRGCRMWRISLTHFAMPHQSILAADLYIFADFPFLQTLAICVDISDIEALSNQPWVRRPISRQRLQLESCFAFGGMRHALLEKFAELLLSCWLDVGLVMIQCTGGASAHGPPDIRHVGAYNHLVRKVRQKKENWGSWAHLHAM
ncbi:hypothetical protein FS749_009134 [Ceratobasidium sp. UAMH 11750]|nr:hypothetical protein FS749_009134 [Ceratobasidium sp. UAMH 11750]